MIRRKFNKPEPATVRGICVLCGKNPQKTRTNGRFAAICSPCDKRLYQDRVKDNKKLEMRRRPYIKMKGPCCESCGFTPVHDCQLDVDHKDGDKSNNDPSNLQTLCANCHRLKTYLSKDWKK